VSFYHNQNKNCEAWGQNYLWRNILSKNILNVKTNVIFERMHAVGTWKNVNVKDVIGELVL
jgi:hypothetical protein